MKKTNNWGINFPDNPYEGQIFYYPHTQDTFTYVVPKNHSGGEPPISVEERNRNSLDSKRESHSHRYYSNNW